MISLVLSLLLLWIGTPATSLEQAWQSGQGNSGPGIQSLKSAGMLNQGSPQLLERLYGSNAQSLLVDRHDNPQFLTPQYTLAKLRSDDISIEEVKQWQSAHIDESSASEPKDATSPLQWNHLKHAQRKEIDKLALREPDCHELVIHCSGTSRGHSTWLQDFAKLNDRQAIDFDFLIGNGLGLPLGEVEIPNKRHSKQSNASDPQQSQEPLQLCLIARDFHDISDEQGNALRELIRYLRAKYGEISVRYE